MVYLVSPLFRARQLIAPTFVTIKVRVSITKSSVGWLELAHNRGSGFASLIYWQIAMNDRHLSSIENSRWHIDASARNSVFSLGSYSLTYATKDNCILKPHTG
jgi:hypothetical protein